MLIQATSSIVKVRKRYSQSPDTFWPQESFFQDKVYACVRIIGLYH